MGFLASAIAGLLSIFQANPSPLPLPPCPYVNHYRWLISPQNIPISILPPKPTFADSAEIYDSENRSQAYNPATYPQFERILAPLNTLNVFGQNITKPPQPRIPTCLQQYANTLKIWASANALTGRVNSYSILLHRITTGDIALNYLITSPLVPQPKLTHKLIRGWLTTLNARIQANPSPYKNNFRIWDFRALAATAYSDYKPTLPYLSQIQSFLYEVITPGGILTSEIRGARTIQYHIYFLSPLFDTLYIIFTDTSKKIQPIYAQLIEVTLQNLERSLLDPSPFVAAAGGVQQIPTNQDALTVLRAKWNCVGYGRGCRQSYAYLLQTLAGRNSVNLR
jgi:hypothetical protein